MMGGIETLLLWSELLLVWMLVNYALPLLAAPTLRLTDPVARGLGVGAGSTLVVGLGFEGLSVAVAGGLLAFALNAGRERFSSRYGAEWEVGMNALFAAGSAVAAIAGQWSSAQSVIALSDAFDPERSTVVFLTLGAAVFLGQGGSHVVRGILDKAGTLPAVAGLQGDEAEIDHQEVSRGALIGALERWLLLLLAMVGSYGGIGFVVAAKGLIRSRDLQSHQYAEYHLVGTLTSTLLALAIGALLTLTVAPLWS